MPNPKNASRVALFGVLLGLALSFPLVDIFNQKRHHTNFPPLLVYIFLIWGLAIAGLYWQVKRMQKP